uniref:G_PROTEIN_RECEP_F1_2 domain-containing protein n=1 Tax=Macrostomum lignano TaxID=282301 RepID=A0A1I8JQG0_9PLAT
RQFKAGALHFSPEPFLHPGCQSKLRLAQTAKPAGLQKRQIGGRAVDCLARCRKPGRLSRICMKLLDLNQLGYFLSLSVNLALILIGNTALLASVARRQKCRMTCFITNLGVADLLVGLVLVLPQIAERLLMQFYGPEFLCKAKFFVQIDNDDNDAMTKRLQISGFQTGCLIAGSWLLSGLYSWPILFWTHVEQHRIFGRQCMIIYGLGQNVTRQEREVFWQPMLRGSQGPNGDRGDPQSRSGPRYNRVVLASSP